VSAANNTKPIDGAIVIAFATAVAYAVAFAYQRAFLGYFGVPAYLVDVEIRGVLLALFAFATFALLAQAILTMWSWRVSRALVAAVARISLVAFVAFVLGVSFGFRVVGWILISLLVAFWIVLEFVTPLWWYPKESTYIAKLEAGFREEASRENAYSWLMSRLGRRFELGLILAATVIIGANALGIYQASRERDFLVIDNAVVIQIRGDIAVCAEFQDKQLTGKLSHVPLSEFDAQLKRVGPLRPTKFQVTREHK